MILMSKKTFPTLTPAHQHKALAALHEITTPESVGALESESIDKDGIATLQYACLLPGYPDWKWNVSLATLPGEEPTVLEAELLPHEGALLAPEWVPWSVRLAEYLEAQKLAAESGIEVDEELSETLLELSEGSLDGVDFDDDIETIDEDDDLDEDSEEEDLDEEDDLDDDEDLDEDDDDEVADLSLITHSGDIDGVDIDILDESSEED